MLAAFEQRRVDQVVFRLPHYPYGKGFLEARLSTFVDNTRRADGFFVILIALACVLRLFVANDVQLHGKFMSFDWEWPESTDIPGGSWRGRLVLLRHDDRNDCKQTAQP
jgi:hypothetical protein